MPAQILFSWILKMVLVGSDCLHVISDSFDYLFRDLHAFLPGKLQSWVKYDGKFANFGKELRWTKFNAVERVTDVYPLFNL